MIAKFAASGKVQAKKNLGLMQMQYKNVYVAYVSMGTNPACTEESRLLWRLSEGTFGEAEPEGRTSGCATVKAGRREPKRWARHLCRARVFSLSTFSVDLRATPAATAARCPIRGESPRAH